MSKVAIDPPGVVALSTATALAAVRLGEQAGRVQGLLDALAVLAPGPPAVRARAARLEADLAALSGTALQHAQRYGDVEGPLRELLTLGYWLPDPHHLAVDLDESAAENLERVLRSDEFGAVPLGLSQSLLEAFRKPSLVIARPGSSLLDLDLTSFSGVVDEVGGVPVVNRGGLLVPAGSSADPAVEAILARSMADDVHQPGQAMFVTEGWGRPPAWARVGGKALGVAGAGLTLWDSFAGQWESDQQLHPEYGTGTRIANASAVAAAEGGGAVLGGLAGAQLGATVGSFVPIPVVGTVGGALIGGAVGSFVGSKAGKAAVTAVEKGAKALWHDVFG